MQRVAVDNPACDIVQVGSSLRPNDGSFSYDLDYNTKCTFMIDDVFSTLLNAIVADGVYDLYFDYRISQTSGIWCPPFDSALYPSQITFNLVSGAFIMYGFMCLFAFCILCFSIVISIVKSKRLESKNPETTNAVEDVVGTMNRDDEMPTASQF